MNFSLLGKLKKPGVTPAFLLVIFGNLWIWRIFEDNLLVAVCVVLSSLILYKSIKAGEFKKVLILLVFILFVFQLNKTELRSLTYLTQQQKVFQLQRLNEHPPVSIALGGKTIWIPLANWMEKRPEALILYRIQENLSGVFSPNLYFFANHPNERVGIKEHEKFPYILLPFFIIGFLNLNFRKNLHSLASFLFAPILLMGLIGTQIDVEPITLFPLIVVCSVFGIEYVWGIVSKLKFWSIKIITAGTFLFFYILIFLQSFLFDRL